METLTLKNQAILRSKSYIIIRYKSTSPSYDESEESLQAVKVQYRPKPKPAKLSNEELEKAIKPQYRPSSYKSKSYRTYENEDIEEALKPQYRPKAALDSNQRQYDIIKKSQKFSTNSYGLARWWLESAEE